MIAGVRLKVCGITSLVDAQAADEAGADELGFILYEKSPRHLPLTAYRAMDDQLPQRLRVAVMVEPAPDALRAAVDAGFGRLQVHFRADGDAGRLAEWARVASPARLCLAPKVEPGREWHASWMEHANTFLVDAYAPAAFGGTGLTSDWTAFRARVGQYPGKHWILAGGLSPANIAAALTESGARHVDVNSGVEVSPGVKSRERLQELRREIERWKQGEKENGEA